MRGKQYNDCHKFRCLLKSNCTANFRVWYFKYLLPIFILKQTSLGVDCQSKAFKVCWVANVEWEENNIMIAANWGSYQSLITLPISGSDFKNLLPILILKHTSLGVTCQSKAFKVCRVTNVEWEENNIPIVANLGAYQSLITLPISGSDILNTYY